MNTKLLPLALACLFGLSLFDYSTHAQTSPAPPGILHPGLREHYPYIRAAIGALERAKGDLNAASHDFGGHRADALAACDNAIAQLNLALQYANANPSRQ